MEYVMNDNNDEINMQIRKFLKQVGVSTHQIIMNEININTDCNVSVKLEINNKEIKKFETIIK